MAVSAQSLATATAKIFRSKLAETADNARAKLATAKAELATLREGYAPLALEIAQEEPGAVERMAALAGEIQRAEQNIAVLTAALAEAEKREAERIATAAEKANQSRVRALAQHTGRLKVNAAAFERAVTDLVESWANMLDSVRRARPLLEGSRNVEHINGLNPSVLTRLALAEISRQAYTEHPSTVQWPLPGSKKPMLWSGDVIKPKLSEIIGDRCEALIAAEGGRGDGGAADE
jgi:hypothetical protein